jgi:hypothetical protein
LLAVSAELAVEGMPYTPRPKQSLKDFLAIVLPGKSIG